VKGETLNVKRGRCQIPFMLILLVSVLSYFCLPLFGHPSAQAETTLVAPEGLQVFDTPSDSGGSLTLIWPPASYDSEEIVYQVLVKEGAQQANPLDFTVIEEFPSNTRYIRDSEWTWWTRPAAGDRHHVTLRSGKVFELKEGVTYSVAVAVVSGEQRIVSETVHAVPEPNWVNWNQLNNLLLALLFGGIVFMAITLARKRDMFLRRIPGLDAVDEAIGRSTELGKPILYLTGAQDMGDPSTIAAAVILGRVAKRAAAYETELMVPHREPITMAVCQEITKQAYLEAGKPDLFKEDSNFFITSDQFSYTAAVDGIMLRKKPAANFFMGAYFAESLLLTETGASTGAIQIAGTDSDHQLPFFVTTCDYTLIGEELYAASAYLSREPVQVGTLRGQDIGKALILGVLIVGTLLATVGVILDAQWPHLFLDIFKDMK